jgi:hypothetical protein
MHQRLINNLSHWFLNKIFQDCLFFSKIRLSAKDKLDREALEGILGSFQVA